MAENSKIEWLAGGSTWNFMDAVNIETGKVGFFCEKIAPECKLCYAEKMNVNTYFGNGIRYAVDQRGKVRITLNDRKLNKPLHWRKSRLVFPCSMTDLFGAWVPDEWIDAAYDVMEKAHWHTFLVLTKRPGRRMEYLRKRYANRPPAPNIWEGTSCGLQETADEFIPLLLQTPAAVRWISAEPLLGSLDIRRYLYYNPVHETNIVGANSLRSGKIWGVGDRSGREDLASNGAAGRQVEGWNPSDTVQAQESGEQDRRGQRLLANSPHEERLQVLRDGSSSCLHPLQGDDPGRTDGESRQRQEERQQVGEPNASDELRAADTCAPCSEGGPSGSARREERDGDPDGRTSITDKATAQERHEAERISTSIQRDIPDNIQNLQGSTPRISWCVAGGESGPNARPMQEEWARSLMQQCKAAGVPFFMKQGAKANWPDFKDFDSFPKDLQVREYPNVR